MAEQLWRGWLDLQPLLWLCYILKILSTIKRLIIYSLNGYRESSINPRGGLFISNPFEGGLNRDGGGGGGGGYLI